ncbi:glutaredoxin-C9-like [Chenopodium quinoa]|uniref:Glutaredoxin domain-containing protein n=1 Tax=Chenopodium quinoa TaxID=63459 RepID=A0A803LPF4_CHEQI|nr:glutaredoxin-C9-like [Chenopodium quinoa]
MAMVKELKMTQEIGNNNNSMMVMMYDKVKAVVGESAVVVFSSSDCCMCHVAKRLLFSLGVGPTVIELDSDKGSAEIQAVLYQLSGEHHPLPAIFVGGKFLGGIESLMASHINGSLVPLLKEAGALWL